MLQTLYIFLCSLPALFTGAAIYLDPGANPVQEMLHNSGVWGLRFLLLCLMVTPSRVFIPLRYNWVRLRRTLGLAAFFYALTHLTVFIIFELGLDFSQVWSEVIERNYILVGFIGLCILLPLAITSTVAWQRRLKKKWLLLHKGVYIATTLAIVHFFMQVKADYYGPIVYASVFFVLMLFRVNKKYWPAVLRKKTTARSAARPKS